MKKLPLLLIFLAFLFIPCINASELNENGGPDDYGHIWIDSEEEDGPEYNWIDLGRDWITVEDMDDDEDQWNVR